MKVQLSYTVSPKIIYSSSQSAANNLLIQCQLSVFSLVFFSQTNSLRVSKMCLFLLLKKSSLRKIDFLGETLVVNIKGNKMGEITEQM
jgi:hypothetical protein